jgi:Domain of unknown function (DUF4160)
MPTVLRIGNYRFHFYSDEGDEPGHIHVDTGDGECKYWLDPVVLARSMGVAPVEVRRIERLVFEHRHFLLERYHEFHRR